MRMMHCRDVFDEHYVIFLILLTKKLMIKNCKRKQYTKLDGHYASMLRLKRPGG